MIIELVEILVNKIKSLNNKEISEVEKKCSKLISEVKKYDSELAEEIDNCIGELGHTYIRFSVENAFKAGIKIMKEIMNL